MTRTGAFFEDRRRSPAGMGAAVLINGAMIAALLTLGTGVITKGPTVIDTIIPTIDPEPKPLPPEPPKERTNPEPRPAPSRPDARPPIVETLDSGLTVTTLPPPRPDVGSLDLGFEAIKPLPPAPKPSVFVGPQIDTRFAGSLQPPYPAAMIRAEEEGVVEVRVLIGPDGRVKRVEKVSADEDAFYRATVEQAMRKWRFKPATRDGEPVEGWRTMTVRFTLDQ